MVALTWAELFQSPRNVHFRWYPRHALRATGALCVDQAHDAFGKLLPGDIVLATISAADDGTVINDASAWEAACSRLRSWPQDQPLGLAVRRKKRQKAVRVATRRRMQDGGSDGDHKREERYRGFEFDCEPCAACVAAMAGAVAAAAACLVCPCAICPAADAGDSGRGGSRCCCCCSGGGGTGGGSADSDSGGDGCCCLECETS